MLYASSDRKYWRTRLPGRVDVERDVRFKVNIHEVLGAISTIAAGPVAAAILVGVATSIVLSRIDREFGLSKKMALALEKAVEKSRSPFDALAREISNWERGFIQNALTKSIR